MDDLGLVRELERDRPLPVRTELTGARDRLLAAMRDERVAAGDRYRFAVPARRRRTGRPRRRWMVAGWAAATAVAAGVAGVLILAPDTVGGRLPAANAEAVQVLRLAAAAALTLPDTPPRADQFVYVRTQTGTGVRESWRSADGTRDGLVEDPGGAGTVPLAGCRNGRATIVRDEKLVPGQTEPCEVNPAYRADLPTDADSMLRYLTRHAGGTTDVNAQGKDVLSLLMESYVRPAARAALFEAAAKIPGLRVVPNAVDGARRPGVGIAWSTDGKSGEMIFDATSHAYLGYAVGRYATAVLQVAIVDAPGQRP